MDSEGSERSTGRTTSRQTAFRKSTGNRRTSPGSRRMSEQRREEILHRIEEIILAEGFDSLTIDEIASRLQCSKATLYAVASSREQLIVKTVQRIFRIRAERIDERVRDAHGGRDRIISYMTAVRDELGALSRAFYDDMRSSEATDRVYRQNAHAAADRLRAYIRDGIDDGDFRPANAGLLGLTVGLLVEAVLDGTLVERLHLEDADAYLEITSLILNVLSPTTP